MRVVFGATLAPPVTRLPDHPDARRRSRSRRRTFTGAFLASRVTTVGRTAGTKNVPTPVEVNVLNATTTCLRRRSDHVHPHRPRPARSRLRRPWRPRSRRPPLRMERSARPISRRSWPRGGTPPYTLVTVSGALPPGLNLNARGSDLGHADARGHLQFRGEGDGLGRRIGERGSRDHDQPLTALLKGTSVRAASGRPELSRNRMP